MTFTRLKLHSVLLMAAMTAACGKTVTNHVYGTKSSTPQTQQTNRDDSSDQSGSGGGVINGGGGKGVLCEKDGKTTVEVLDLYEAKTLYSLSLADFGATEELAKERLAQVLARHFWNPHTIEPTEYAKGLKENFIQNLLNNVRFIGDGKKLRLTNDSFEPILEDGCRAVQVAIYYDESVLLVDKHLWNQMDWTNKMGLLAHEALYFLARQSGTRNSMSTRKLVGMLFSDKGVTPVADKVPASRDKFLDCRLTSSGVSKGSFFMYRSRKAEEKKDGIEIVMRDIGEDSSLFRTSVFLEDLTFAQLLSARFKGTRQATLIRDTYPARDTLSLSFKGVHDGSLTAEMRILRGGGSTVTGTFNVSCELRSKLEDLDPLTTEPGEFHSQPGDGSIDLLVINGNGSLTLEQTRQVGGLSHTAVVPYPTVCRFKHSGMITQRDDQEIRYTVSSAELGSLEGITNTAHCGAYIDDVNRRAADGSLNYTIRLKDFTKVK